MAVPSLKKHFLLLVIAITDSHCSTVLVCDVITQAVPVGTSTPRLLLPLLYETQQLLIQFHGNFFSQQMFPHMHLLWMIVLVTLMWDPGGNISSWEVMVRLL